MPSTTCHYCGIDYTITTSEYNRKVKNSSKTYCCKEHASMARRMFTSEDDKKYKAYLTNKEYRERHKDKIKERRRQYHLNKYQPRTNRVTLPIGAERERLIRGKKEVFVKTANGWRIKNKKVRTRSAPKPKVKVKNKITSATRLPAKKEPSKQLNLTPNLKGRKLIKIDHKTWVYRKIG